MLRLYEAEAGDILLDEPAPLDLIRPFIQMQPPIQNRLPEPHGYGVFYGSEACVSDVKVLSVPAGAEVVLASDGYPTIADDLRAKEAILHACLEADPLMIGRYPRVKGLSKGQVSFDDRSYVRFRVPATVSPTAEAERARAARRRDIVRAE